MPYSNINNGLCSPQLQLSCIDEWVNKSGISEEITRLNVQAVSGEDIFERLYPNPQRLNGGRLNSEYLRYHEACQGAKGWWFQNRDIEGNESGFGQFKADKGNPLCEVKYRSPKGMSSEPLLVRMPDEDYWLNFLMSERPLVITEGVKKAASLLTQGVPAIGLTGCYNFRTKDKNLHPVIEELARNREVYILFDNDPCLKTKRDVNKAKDKLAALLTQAKADVKICSLPSIKLGEKLGVDDFIVAGGDLKSVFHHALDYKEWQKPKTYYARFSRIQEFIGNRLRLNVISGEIEFDGEPVNWDTFHSYYTRNIDSLSIPREQFDAAALYIATEENPYNPVTDYLDSLPETSGYDLESVAVKYFGSQPGSLECQLVKKWLIAAVARAYEPGCSVDNALFLFEKKGGTGKSKWFQTLCPDPTLFNDDMGDIRDKDEKLKLHQHWIIEWAELDGIFSRQDSSRIKSFLTTTRDNIRSPYARASRRLKRRSVLCGSTNKKEFLNDASGQRRYWIVPVHKRIPLDLLTEERDEIWAAAKQLYLAGERWWDDEHDQMRLETHLKGYRMEQLWEPEIKDFLEHIGDRDRFHISELRKFLELNNHDPQFTRKAKQILEDLGWESKRFYLHGKRDRGFVLSPLLSPYCPPHEQGVSAYRDNKTPSENFSKNKVEEVKNDTQEGTKKGNYIETSSIVPQPPNPDISDGTLRGTIELVLSPLPIGSRVEILIGHHEGKRGTVIKYTPSNPVNPYLIELDDGTTFLESATYLKGPLPETGQ